MKSIHYINRKTGHLEEEKVFGEKALHFLYGNPLGKIINICVAKSTLASHLYGWWQKQSWTKKKIAPFIEYFKMDPTEFLEPIDRFQSFNDFFIRKLKSETRPLIQDDKTAIIPADARYLFFQNIAQTDGFIIKGQKFSLKTLLQDDQLAARYENGSMVIARLCPTDYHRFHFPFDTIPSQSKLINGHLYSVNPVALRQNIHIFTQNKRVITSLQSETFGTVLFIEIGATNVGSIHQTYTPNKPYKKGDEKGYFSFGGSSLILLFEKDRIALDQDLLEASKQGVEIRALMGQSMGKTN